MKSIGIDLGSRTIKIVVMDGNEMCGWDVCDSTSHPADVARKMLSPYGSIPVVASGYGRNLLELEDIPSVTEIKACARGTRHVCPDADLIFDIGGQDLKTIVLDSRGKIAKFEMNDRCAAGTGKFLEIMADKLGYSLNEFGDAALRGKNSISISSVCTVFAESEVIGLLNRGAHPADIAHAVHYSVVRKLCAMSGRITGTQRLSVCCTGGGAWNSCVKALLEKELGSKISVPPNPQIVVALGAALIAQGN